jgi:mercuric ion transport protein
MQPKNSNLKPVAQGRMALLTGGVAAILASTCCLGPLVLILLGFSGALEPYRPFFIGVALMALYFAGRRMWRPVAACQPGEVCAMPQVRRSYQFLYGLVALLVLVALAFPYVAPLFY